MLSLVVQTTTVFVQFEIVHEPISGSSIANVDVFESLLLDLPKVIDRVCSCAFTDIRGFARDSHDSTKF